MELGVERREDREEGGACLEEADHGLQAADEAKVDSVLEGREDHYSAGEEDLPVGPPPFSILRCRHGEL